MMTRSGASRQLATAARVRVIWWSGGMVLSGMGYMDFKRYYSTLGMESS